MVRGVGGESPANVLKHIEGVSFPADKEDLVRKAEENDAPEEVLTRIRDLPEERFGGPQDILKAYGGGT